MLSLNNADKSHFFIGLSALHFPSCPAMYAHQMISHEWRSQTAPPIILDPLWLSGVKESCKCVFPHPYVWKHRTHYSFCCHKNRTYIRQSTTYGIQHQWTWGDHVSWTAQCSENAGGRRYVSRALMCCQQWACLPRDPSSIPVPRNEIGCTSLATYILQVCGPLQWLKNIRPFNDFAIAEV